MKNELFYKGLHKMFTTVSTNGSFLPQWRGSWWSVGTS